MGKPKSFKYVFFPCTAHTQVHGFLTVKSVSLNEKAIPPLQHPAPLSNLSCYSENHTPICLFTDQ